MIKAHMTTGSPIRWTGSPICHPLQVYTGTDFTPDYYPKRFTYGREESPQPQPRWGIMIQEAMMRDRGQWANLARMIRLHPNSFLL